MEAQQLALPTFTFIECKQQRMEIWVLSFNLQLLLENTKVGTHFVPAPIFAEGDFSTFSLSANASILAPASGMDLCRAEKLRGWEVRSQAGPWAAGVRTAGFGPEPDQQRLNSPGLHMAK